MNEVEGTCVYCAEQVRRARDSLTGWRHVADGSIACANEWGLASLANNPALTPDVRYRLVVLAHRSRNQSSNS